MTTITGLFLSGILLALALIGFLIWCVHRLFEYRRARFTRGIAGRRINLLRKQR